MKGTTLMKKTKEEVRNEVESHIQWLMDEASTTDREEIIECAATNYVYMYNEGMIDSEELQVALDYLGCECNMVEIDKEKAKRIKRKNKRK